MNIQIFDYFEVELVDYMGSDELICKAARVSTLGAASIDSQESEGLINFLMKNRHGSPFEHGTMTFRIWTPIVVWREFMRHRIGFSYNEQSGRYMELSPHFYIPDEWRNLIQVGKAGAYDFHPGTPEQYRFMVDQLEKAYSEAWRSYQAQLNLGIAKEVARLCLPVSLYSTAYVTCNPRSLMNFLSLRTIEPESTFPSYPMKEINVVASMMEGHFSELFPITWRTFRKNGSVAP